MRNATDRRAFEGFQMELPVELRFKQLRLHETTVNIGSGGPSRAKIMRCTVIRYPNYTEASVAGPLERWHAGKSGSWRASNGFF
jgi:hypothetical protein